MCHRRSAALAAVSVLVFMRDGKNTGTRRHPVAMHEQKQFQQLYFGLLNKLIAASTPSKKMCPAPSVYCTGNLAGLLSRKSASEEQNQKAKGLGEVDVSSLVHSLLSQHIWCLRCPTAGRDSAGSASHPVTARLNPGIIFHGYFKGPGFR